MTRKDELIAKLQDQGFGPRYLEWARKKPLAALEKLVLVRPNATTKPFSATVNSSRQQLEFTQKAAAKSREEYEARVVQGADYYTASRWLGGHDFEVNWQSTLADAEAVAQELADRYRRIILVYAVRGAYTAHVKNVAPAK